MAIDKLDTQLFVGLKAFISRGDKVLVLRDPNYAVNNQTGLDFPGGKYRAGGKIEDELLREIDEETGLTVKIGRPFYTWTSRYKSVKEHQRNVFLVGYLCEYTGGEVRLSEEHDKFEWVDENDYNKWKDHTEYFAALDKYFKLR